MPIDTKHREYSAMLGNWQTIDDICNVRGLDKYLVPLNPSDQSAENNERNVAYRQRAVFYPVASHTLQGMVGLVFAKQPLVELPQQLEYLLENTDGSGVTLLQQAQYVTREVLMKSRAALFVSYPKTDAPASRADMDARRVFATIHALSAEQVVNWRVETVGAKSILSLVVLREAVDEAQTDGFEVKRIEQYRELALQSGIFVVRVWRKNERGQYVVIDETVPLDANGDTWDEIPFTFVCSTDNTPSVEIPLMLPMCKVNIGHYRNSADYEDSVWFSGQAQPWMSGLTQAHIDMMRENRMYVGSRNCLGVPPGETFGFASAPPNTMVRQALLDKQEMMIALGARLIQPGGAAKTATEINRDAQVQHSALSLAAINVSVAYQRAMAWCARYVGADGDVSFRLNNDFVMPTATAQDIQSIVAAFVQGAIPMSDYLRYMQRAGVIDARKSLEDFAAEVSLSQVPDLDVSMPADNG